MRAALSLAERKSELIALSGARLLLDSLEGASITVKTVTVYSGGRVYIDEVREGEAEFAGENLARTVLEAAYCGGGTAVLKAFFEGREITWLCEFSSLEKDEIEKLDIGAPLLISVASEAEGRKAGERASAGLTAVIREFTENVYSKEPHMNACTGPIHTYSQRRNKRMRNCGIFLGNKGETLIEGVCAMVLMLIALGIMAESAHLAASLLKQAERDGAASRSQFEAIGLVPLTAAVERGGTGEVVQIEAFAYENDAGFVYFSGGQNWPNGRPAENEE
jgi:hypothetical protein